MTPFHYLKIENTPNQDVIKLLEDNEIGTPGESMVYKLHRVADKLKDVPDPYFANLVVRSSLLATVCISKRKVYNLGQQISAYYIRYFTFKEKFRSSIRKRKAINTRSNLRNDVKLLLSGNGLDVKGDLVLYAYVDAQNKRSKRLIDEFGFQVVGGFSVISFSRLFPGFDAKVQACNQSDESVILSCLKTFYNCDQLVSFELLFKRGKYYYIIEEGKVVCGLQAVVDQWDILEMPGLIGKLLMIAVPRLPIINRLFNPNYKFALFELVFCQPGHEQQLAKLFESVLYRLQVNTGIMCVDAKSKVYKSINQINLGLVHKIQGEKKIDIVAKTSLSGALNKNLPFAVSGFDVL